MGDGSGLCDALAAGGAVDCRAPDGVEAGDSEAVPHAVVTKAMPIAVSCVRMRPLYAGPLRTDYGAVKVPELKAALVAGAG